MAWDDMRVAWVTLSPRRDEGVCRVAAMAYGVEPDARRDRTSAVEGQNPHTFKSSCDTSEWPLRALHWKFVPKLTM